MDYAPSELTVYDDMICAAHEADGRESDNCPGDSGSPLVETETGLFVGIVSWGGLCHERGAPSVYTSIGSVYDFIKANIAC